MTRLHPSIHESITLSIDEQKNAPELPVGRFLKSKYLAATG
jgi:hypothetical protein